MRLITTQYTFWTKKQTEAYDKSIVNIIDLRTKIYTRS